MQAKKSRLTDVAQLSGVSIATVSNVVNRRTNVAEHTRVRVETVLKQLDYKPNEHALALRRESLVQRLDPPSGSSEPGLGAPDATDAGQAVGGAGASATLSEGDAVSIRVNGQVLQGVVDAQMPDGSGFWLWCLGAGRKFVSRDWDDDPPVSGQRAVENGLWPTGLPTPFI
jgi:hypothetical protein